MTSIISIKEIITQKRIRKSNPNAPLVIKKIRKKVVKREYSGTSIINADLISMADNHNCRNSRGEIDWGKLKDKLSEVNAE